MARIYPLFSSSSGNSAFIGDKNAGVLIDAGASFKKLCCALNLNEIPLSAIKGIFITHSHSDHVKGLKLLTAKSRVPVFGQRETLSELLKKELISPCSDIYELDSPASVGGMKISCFDTPHDTVRSCGYKIEHSDGRTCAVCTDLGCVTKTVDENINGCDLVLIESNYDPLMLKKGPYPYFLKERIFSDRGHLSNENCAKQVKKLIKSGTTRIILGHLSRENNTPKTAEETVLKELDEFKRDKDYILSVAPVETKGEVTVF